MTNNEEEQWRRTNNDYRRSLLNEFWSKMKLHVSRNELRSNEWMRSMKFNEGVREANTWCSKNIPMSDEVTNNEEQMKATDEVHSTSIFFKNLIESSTSELRSNEWAEDSSGNLGVSKKLLWFWRNHWLLLSLISEKSNYAIYGQLDVWMMTQFLLYWMVCFTSHLVCCLSAFRLHFIWHTTNCFSNFIVWSTCLLDLLMIYWWSIFVNLYHHILVIVPQIQPKSNENFKRTGLTMSKLNRRICH